MTKTFCLTENAITDWIASAHYGDKLAYAGHGPGEDVHVHLKAWERAGFPHAMRMSSKGLVSLVQRRTGKDCLRYEMQRTSKGLMT